MRFITCRLPDGVEDPAILSADGRQVWPLSWLGLSYETLSDAIPFLTPQVRAGLSLAIAGIPALPIEAVTLESPIPAPAQDVICLGINYMAHSDEAEKYSADAFATRHQDAIYFSKRVNEAVAPGGDILSHSDLVADLDYEAELAVVIGKALLGKRKNFALRLLTTALGAVAYYFILAIVIWAGLSTTDLKLFSALVVTVFLAIPYLRKKWSARHHAKGGSAVC